MVFKVLCYLHLGSEDKNNESQPVRNMTKPIITRGCHSISLETLSRTRNTSLEKNNVTNCYQFCFFNQSELAGNALLMKGTECVCAAVTPRTSFDTAKRCNERCPGNSNQSCGGNGTSTYAVYEIEKITSNDQKEGCGFVEFQRHIVNQTLEYGDCNEMIMAYCTKLANTDGTMIMDTNLTWNEHYNKCSGHLAFINDTKNVQWKSENSRLPSFRFWIGHRIWSYVPYESSEFETTNNDPVHISGTIYIIFIGWFTFLETITSFLDDSIIMSLTNKDDIVSLVSWNHNILFITPYYGVLTYSNIFFNKQDNADSSNDTESASPKKEKNKSSDVPSNLNWITAATGPVVVFLIILLAIVCVKRRKAKLNSSTQPKNASSKNDEVPLQPIRGQTNQDHDYDHLHGNPGTNPMDNVYDVSGNCVDGSNISDNVYNTTKQCSGDEMYDSSVNNPQRSESENIINNDMYSTMSRHDGGNCPTDMILYDHTSSIAQNNDKTDIYNEIDT
ncbi:uncharacterized protein LOC133189838 [Saccostrea echinata]|uniref:uncharacterized protein LOC133189838 n=1 Tax=Saccostrea echinata TaxID=191078 RepID=UPI002A827E17|nr:uncharacterized protein LOC133189838 [Saccostrea echinata]